MYSRPPPRAISPMRKGAPADRTLQLDVHPALQTLPVEDVIARRYHVAPQARHVHVVEANGALQGPALLPIRFPPVSRSLFQVHQLNLLAATTAPTALRVHQPSCSHCGLRTLRSPPPSLGHWAIVVVLGR